MMFIKVNKTYKKNFCIAFHMCRIYDYLGKGQQWEEKERASKNYGENESQLRKINMWRCHAETYYVRQLKDLRLKTVK